MKAIDLSRHHVFIIDNNRDMLVLLRIMLRDMGCQAVEDASDGLKAYDLLKDGYTPHLIITDWMMPIITGIELVYAIRSPNELGRSTPIVMMSEFQDDAHEAEARDAGVDEFLGKPFSNQDMTRCIAAVTHFRRPFIRAPRYNGPDRRRRVMEDYPGPERRKNPPKK